MKIINKKNFLIVLLVTLVIMCCLLLFVSKKANAETEITKPNYILQDCADIYHDKHGEGRANGGTGILETGCRNYICSSFNYGSMDIPFWINIAEINKISNLQHRETILNRIRVQAEMWNTAYMYGGAGKLVNFYEVYSVNKPSDSNGRKVIEILPYDFLHDDDNTNDNYAGAFDSRNYTIQLGYDFISSTILLGKYTVMHEFGHVLGLADIDKYANHGLHKVLMGYDRINIECNYPDIQGAMVACGKHVCTKSSLLRYVYEENKYKYICFYCDWMISYNSLIPGSSAIQSNIGCVHDYQPIVSIGEVRWDKCTKCYNIRKYNDFVENINKEIQLYSYGTNNIQFNCINAVNGKLMPEVDRIAPGKTGYAFDGYCDILGKKYYHMEVQNDEQTASINLLDRYFVEKVVPVYGKIWDKNTKTTLYPIWKPLVGEYVYDNITDGKILSSTTVQLNNGKNFISPIEIKDYKFKYFMFGDKKYTSIPAEIDIKLKRDNYNFDINTKKDLVTANEVLCAYYEKDSCLAEGSLITLADGSQVAVENLTGNEMLLVWNLYTGAYDTAPILFIDKDPLSVYKVINLTFSDGTTVKVISEHGFWDYNLNKYVYIDEDNAESFIGHWFNKGQEKIQLTGVEIKEEQTAAYSPVTYGHLCYFVNGMLSMPGGIDGLFNIFDVDAETMKYDEISMQLDIETYGLFTYEEFITYLNLPEEVFEAFNAQYFKVAIGKGLITVDRLSSLYERYADLLA